MTEEAAATGQLESGQAESESEGADAGFDLGKAPVSTVALGEFPFVSLPEGYEPINKPRTLSIARVPFWTGDRLEQVEGKTYVVTIQAQKGVTYSAFELMRNIEHVIEQAGGVKVTDSRIPSEVLKSVGSDVSVGLIDGWGDVYNNPVQTYVIRTADKTVWVHLCSNSMDAGLLIVEAQAFEPTASLLPADALKQQLDIDGKVALQIHFAVDKADILPESQPQVDQVLKLLQQHPSLKLSVDGHTDNTGNADRNQALSEARAQAVAAALTAQGIEAKRLQAQGFGQSQPVADNSTQDGKAANRRVELVRLD
ncbi:OmpA family protein [Lysobacter alkalisoli]|uniref:OmpA family protein n=2 Tax=Marilutibacter alkalisoli TaxID=2591633 RepID=A0A514BX18_9GAMM|nr:OmpA family protein [Lysobacter alkalisoli]